MVTTQEIKELRDQTGISVMECKKALEESGGDFDKAIEILRKKSKDIASKKADRTLGSGVVSSYLHSNRLVGSLVELDCETDFVAGNDEFRALAYDIAMHIAATNPEYVDSCEITDTTREKAILLFKDEIERDAADKPVEIKDKILAGKVASYFKERVLLEQPFVKDESKTIAGLLQEGTQKFGEKIVVSRFSRFGIFGR